MQSVLNSPVSIVLRLMDASEAKTRDMIKALRKRR